MMLERVLQKVYKLRVLLFGIVKFYLTLKGGKKRDE